MKRGIWRSQHSIADVRIAVARPDGALLVLASGVDAKGPFPSLAEALAHTEQTYTGIVWAHDVAPCSAEETACPICGAGKLLVPRYPTQLCWPCVLEAVDEKGRPVRFYNTDFMGFGCERVDDEGKRVETGACLVRGVRCLAAEAYFGGIVVTIAR